MTSTQNEPVQTFAAEARNCEHHGEYQSSYVEIMGRKLYMPCPGCAEVTRQRSEQRRIEQEQREWEKYLDIACIPRRFQTRTLENYHAETAQQQKALDFAIEYAEGWEETQSYGRCALFVGKPGTGKTHLAVGIMTHIMRKNFGRVSVRFTSVSRIIRRLKDSYRKDGEESEVEVMRDYSKCALLVIDEVGVQFGTDFEKNTLFDIINDRYENMRPTVLTSNLSADGVREYLGERAFDRLRENGGKCIAFAWDSYRGVAA